MPKLFSLPRADRSLQQKRQERLAAQERRFRSTCRSRRVANAETVAVELDHQDRVDTAEQNGVALADEPISELNETGEAFHYREAASLNDRGRYSVDIRDEDTLLGRCRIAPRTRSTAPVGAAV